jgi:hypothetical protein
MLNMIIEEGKSVRQQSGGISNYHIFIHHQKSLDFFPHRFAFLWKRPKIFHIQNLIRFPSSVKISLQSERL